MRPVRLMVRHGEQTALPLLQPTQPGLTIRAFGVASPVFASGRLKGKMGCHPRATPVWDELTIAMLWCYSIIDRPDSVHGRGSNRGLQWLNRLLRTLKTPRNTWTFC